MRKGLTLIELILSMVIIAVVFTVIPRLVQSMNQGSAVAIKEEAMYNAMAQIGMILNLPWDNNNTQNAQILSVTSGGSAYTCDTASGYRIGGFIGGRNCVQPPGGGYAASAVLGREDAEYNDIDDYRDASLTAEKNCSGTAKGLYAIETSVAYVDDPAATGSAQLLTTPKGAGQTSNTKYIRVRVGYGSDSHHTGCIATLEYHAMNIGHIQINARSW